MKSQSSEKPIKEPSENKGQEGLETQQKQHNRNFFRNLLERGGVISSTESKQRKKKLKAFRKAKHIPSESEVERFNPPLNKGLSEEQVETRFEQFLINDVNKRYSKSYRSIFIGNICTFFNLLCFVVAFALALAGANLSQFLFVAIFAFNLIIGIVQEILAKKQIDKLSLIVSSKTKVIRNGIQQEIAVTDLVLDDVIYLEAGQQVPADCILQDGIVEVNESLLTGESDSVKKREGDMLYAGSFVASGACRVRAEKVGKASYLNNLTAKAKKYKRPSSEIMNSIRVFIRSIGVLIVPLAALMFFSNLRALGLDSDAVTWENIAESIQLTGAIIVGMIPSGLLLLTSLAMAMGVLRLSKKQTLVQDLYSLEMLARVNVLCLDKTGTITDGRMTVSDCMILNNHEDYSVDEIMGSMLLALDDNNQTSMALQDKFGHSHSLQSTAIMPFSSKRKLSAVTFGDVGTFVFGAPEFVLRPLPPRIERITKQYAQMGMRVLLLAHSKGAIKGEKLPSDFEGIALITLADNIRPEAIETIKWFADNDVNIRIISGDNPVTVSEVARRVGVKNANKYISLDGLTDIEIENVANEYTVFGRVTPEQKAVLVKTLKRNGNTVAMTGDGVNDILALKEANCAISVASGSEAARNVSHLVLLNNNFMNLPSVVEEGRRVINNIKNCASLYIMKTLFTMILALICLMIPDQQYFFKTNNLILFEFVVAAIPSFVISLQPNHNRVRGKFIPYVISRAVPGAITMILCILAVYFGNKWLWNYNQYSVKPLIDPETGEEVFAGISVISMYGFGQNFSPILVLAVTFGGIVMLYRIMQPLNVMRWVVYAACVAVCFIVFSIPFLAEIVYGMGFTVQYSVIELLFIVCVILAAFPISGFLVKICDMFTTD